MSFYKTQGTLPLDAPSYVERQADQQLLQALLNSEHCHVLTSRQMGKSSLMVHTARQLRNLHIQVVQIDLQAIGVNLTPEQFYDGLVMKIGRQLNIENELEDFWLDHDRIGPVQRLFTALHDIVLPHLQPSATQPAHPKLVLFIDEIDVVRTLKFSTDEFFAAIRRSFNARSSDPIWNQLTFVLLGVATPAELIRDPSVTLFNLSRQIELTDFTPEEAAPLAQGMQRPSAEAHALLEQVLYWTHGHPYLTQRLCQHLAANPQLKHPTDVDRTVAELFLGRHACENDENLLFVRERLLRAGELSPEAVRTYEQVHARQGVADDPDNPVIHLLHLAGIVRAQNGLLITRNRIYLNTFHQDWISQTLKSFGDPDSITVAVLPFVDLSSEDNEYLCDGLTDELINALGQVQRVRIASRTSSFEFKGKSADPKRVATKLQVAFLVEGTLRHLGRRLKVAARLISATTGNTVWSGDFKYTVDDVHLIPGEISRTLSSQLLPLAGRPPQPESTRHIQPPDRQAYHFYLKGRFHWNQRHETSITQSITLYTQALEKDPDFAAAHAGLAEAYLILGIYNFKPPCEVQPLAKNAALRALEIDESQADAHSALACVHAVYDFDWVRSEQAFRRALQLNPSYAQAHLWFAINCLTPLGRHEESLNALHLAQELDPLSIRIGASTGLALHFARRNEEAVAQCRYTLEVDGTSWLTHLFLGHAYMALGQLQSAQKAYQSAIEFSRQNVAALAALAQCLALQHHTTEAENLLQQLLQLSTTSYIPACDIACIYDALQQTEPAREWMQKAQEEHSYRLIYNRVDPRFQNFQSDTTHLPPHAPHAG